MPLPPEASIRSLRHPVAAALAAHRRPGARREAAVCVAEGPHLVAEALAAGLTPALAVLRERQAAGSEWGDLLPRLTAALARPAAGSALPRGLFTATERVFDSLSPLPAPQGILVLFHTPPEPPASAPPPACALALDGVQDPGNVGTLARALLAFGGAGALLLCGTATADPFGDKALRASAGAAFHLGHRFTPDLPAALRALRAAGIRWWALCPRGGVPPRAADLASPVGLVVGSEGRGVSPAVLAECALLTVPMPGPAESLNAAVAGGIVLYEAGLRRGGGTRTGHSLA